MSLRLFSGLHVHHMHVPGLLQVPLMLVPLHGALLHHLWSVEGGGGGMGDLVMLKIPDIER